MSCASESDLLVLALPPDGTDIDGAVERHVRACSFCSARLAELRHVVDAMASSTTLTSRPTDGCLDESALAEFAQGSSAGGARAGRVAHLATCARCRHQLASIVTLLADPEISSEVHRDDQVGKATIIRRGTLRLAGLAAAVVVFAIAWPRRDVLRQSVPSHRGASINGIAEPVPSSPTGDVDDISVLRWTAVAGADRYRVRVFDQRGHVMFEKEVDDTAVTLPDSIVVVPGRSYLWGAEARSAVDRRWTSSDLIEFRLSRGRAP